MNVKAVIQNQWFIYGLVIFAALVMAFTGNASAESMVGLAAVGAIGKASDFQIYDEQFFGGMIEVIEQNADAFNAQSNGALMIVPERVLGNYEKESFFKLVSGLVSRRDTTSVAAATDLALTQGEHVSVKLNRKIGPVAQTLDAFRKIGMDSETASFVIGQQIGQAVAVNYITMMLEALNAAITNVAALNYDATGQSTPTLTHTHLVSGLALFGDNASKVVCWAMHSKPWFDLMKQSLADKIFEVAGVTIYSGTVATFGRPVIVTDSDALHDPNGSATDTYNILGLVPGAGVIKESEERNIVSDIVTGLENLVIRLQGEYAFNLGLKGYAWDVTNGGANPSDAAIATGTNWDKVATDNKSTAGFRIKTQ